MGLGNTTKAIAMFRSATTGRMLPSSNMTAQEIAEYDAWLASGGAAQDAGISALPKWIVWGGLAVVIFMMWKESK